MTDDTMETKRQGPGCLSLLFRLLLMAWLVWYAIKLWGSRPGDVPAPTSEIQEANDNQ